MNKNRRLWLVGLTIIVLLAAVVISLAMPRVVGQAKVRSLVGSWWVEILPYDQDCNCGGIYTFLADGTVITDDSDLADKLAHGEWIKTGSDQATYTVVFIIPGSEPDPWIKGRVDGLATYDVTAGQWSGPFTLTLSDQDGNTIESIPGTIRSTDRIEVVAP